LFYPHINEPLGSPISSKDSSLEKELPEFLDNFTSKSKTILITLDIGNLHLVAPRVRLVEVPNVSEGALPFHLEDTVEGGIEILTGER